MYRIFGLALFAIFFSGYNGACAQDTAPPNILSFDFSPREIDTGAYPQDITFTARLTDDLSGIGPTGDIEWGSSAIFQSPSGNQRLFVDLASRFRVSGTDLDGIYENNATLPKYSEHGIWTLEYLIMYDRVGNRRDLSREDIIALGFPSEFEVISIGDTMPPNILSFDFSPREIDTGAYPQDITFTARLTDDLSGIGPTGDIEWGSSAIFQSPSGNQRLFVDLASRFRVSGTDLDGIYENNATLPKYSEHGIWTLEYLIMYDRVGNRRDLSREDIIALGFPSEFEVISIGDTMPPNILSFDFSPREIDTGTYPQDIIFTARLTDDLSGIGPTGDIEWGSSAIFQSPSGNQRLFVDLASRFRVSGTDLDGIYENNATLSKYSEHGIWTLEYLIMYDRVGNRRELSREDIIALGFPANFSNDEETGTEPTILYYPDFTDSTNAGSWRSWLLLQNPANSAANVTLNIRSRSGGLLYQGNQIIPAGNTSALRPRELVGADCSGSVVLSSNQTIRGSCQTTRNNNEMCMSYSAMDRLSSSLYFPDFTDSASNNSWRSWLVIQNPNPTSANINLVLRSRSAQLIGSAERTIPAYGVLAIRPRDIAGADCSGSAVITSDQPLAATCQITRNSNKMCMSYTAAGSN